MPSTPAPLFEASAPALPGDEPGGRPAAPLLLVGLEFSLSTASLDALEDVSLEISYERVADWFSRSPGVEEVALIATCHRVEMLLVARSFEDVAVWTQRLPGEPGSWRRREGRAAVRHLFRVAAGGESLAHGEAEVREQVRLSGSAVKSRHPRPLLRSAITSAVAAAQVVYPSVPGSRSVAAIAVARLLELAPVTRPDVLVIGSGTVGRQVVRALAGRAAVTVAYHRRPPDGAFLLEHGARAVPLEAVRDHVTAADAVVSAAKIGHRGLRAADLRDDRPRVLIDLGVPRNIDPDVRSRPNTRLVDLEELYALAPTREDPTPEMTQIELRADRCADELEGHLFEPWVGTIRRAAEATRHAELENARRFLGALDRDQELAIERLTRRLVDRLLLGPTERMRALPPGPDGDGRRRFAVELLAPGSSGP